jgi:hypothetical protein
MPARDYPQLGGIGGVQNNPPVAYSPRGLDRDSVQTFVFECDPLDPLTALLHFQGSNDEPLSTTPENSRLWVDLLSMNVLAEGGVFFIETRIEVSQVRLVCKDGNYTGGKLKHCRTMR